MYNDICQQTVCRSIDIYLGIINLFAVALVSPPRCHTLQSRVPHICVCVCVCVCVCACACACACA